MEAKVWSTANLSILFWWTLRSRFRAQGKIRRDYGRNVSAILWFIGRIHDFEVDLSLSSIPKEPDIINTQPLWLVVLPRIKIPWEPQWYIIQSSIGLNQLVTLINRSIRLAIPVYWNRIRTNAVSYRLSFSTGGSNLYQSLELWLNRLHDRQ